MATLDGVKTCYTSSLNYFIIFIWLSPTLFTGLTSAEAEQTFYLYLSSNGGKIEGLVIP